MSEESNPNQLLWQPSVGFRDQHIRKNNVSPSEWFPFIQSENLSEVTW